MCIRDSINTVRLGADGGCLREEWKTWADCCEDEACVSAMSAGEEEEGVVTALKHAKEKCKGDL
eukprot:2161840-Prorocentrum_lima.AAC.1